MYKLLVVTAFSLFSFVSLAAQANRTSEPNAPPVPSTSSSMRPDPIGSRTIGGLKVLNQPTSKGEVLMRFTKEHYRKPTEIELAAIAPPPEVISRYREFLKRPDARHFRLVVDQGCSEGTEVVVATDDCLKYTMPGSGSSYSFRSANYVVKQLGDLFLDGPRFYVPGELMHGVLVELGPIPIESVTRQTPGMKYLFDFQPASDARSGKDIDAMLIKGIDSDGFHYGKELKVAPDMTYAMRSVAYRGVVPRVAGQLKYNELNYDLRKDVVVIFKVVDVGADGSVTILSSKLSSKEAPEIK